MMRNFFNNPSIDKTGQAFMLSDLFEHWTTEVIDFELKFFCLKVFGNHQFFYLYLLFENGHEIFSNCDI